VGFRGCEHETRELLRIDRRVVALEIDTELDVECDRE
jgi:hypothetical protein